MELCVVLVMFVIILCFFFSRVFVRLDLFIFGWLIIEILGILDFFFFIFLIYFVVVFSKFFVLLLVIDDRKKVCLKFRF